MKRIFVDYGQAFLLKGNFYLFLVGQCFLVNAFDILNSVNERIGFSLFQGLYFYPHMHKMDGKLDIPYRMRLSSNHYVSQELWEGNSPVIHRRRVPPWSTVCQRPG